MMSCDAQVFDQALEGGGAKNINFQELAADLAMVTYNYPFRIPPYFALIIRAIGEPDRMKEVLLIVLAHCCRSYNWKASIQSLSYK